MGILPSDWLLETVTKNILRKDKNNMNEKLYYTAAEIAQMIGVGRTTAYGIVKQMNEELLWSSIFVTLVAKKYHESVTLPSGLRMVYDNH